MIPDLMASGSYRLEKFAMLVQGRILTHDEKRDGQVPRLEKIQHARDQNIQVRRKRLPPRIAVRLQIGPLVVKVQ
jgi:hypothetical protein